MLGRAKTRVFLEASHSSPPVVATRPVFFTPVANQPAQIRDIGRELSRGRGESDLAVSLAEQSPEQPPAPELVPMVGVPLKPPPEDRGPLAAQ